MAVGSDCPSGKIQFATREAAGECRDGLRAGHRRDGVTSNPYVYRCDFCDCYHVGNRRAQEARRRRGADRR